MVVVAMVRFLQVPDAVCEIVKVFLDARSFLALVTCSPLAVGGEGLRIVDFRRNGSRRVRFRSLALSREFNDFSCVGMRVERVFPVLEEWAQEFHTITDIDECDGCGLRVEFEDLAMCSVFDKSSAAHPPGSASQPKATISCCRPCASSLRLHSTAIPMRCHGLGGMMVLWR